MSAQRRAVVVGYARTPFVRYCGRFAAVPAVDLGAHAIRAALARAGVGPGDVQRVLGGHVLQGGAGQNPARQAAVAAGIPLSTPASTLNAVCLSGMQAVADAAALVEAGRADVVVAFGMESMSLAPHVAPMRSGRRYGALELVDTLEHDGLTDATERRSMGASTEARNAGLGLARGEQDAWAAASHQRAAAAAPWLAGEVEPFRVVGRGRRSSDTDLVTDDDGVRPETTAEGLGRLRPAFSADGSVTAGNASQVTDGAAALVLTSADLAASRGLAPLAEVLATSFVAGPDVSLHAQPAVAVQRVLAEVGAPASELASVEVNEAFAAVAVHSTRLLGVDPERVNPHGGAIALGHPLGASGARVVGTLARTLADAGAGRLGAAALCGGGGQGMAVLLRAL
ncbi:acetyl-CoA C-acyltransferase [Quadrisphaera sp. KR29]|uniref:acetyl-CoA C-acyltransferase n=1 Tax=Quadrisphaera sp. KR29 TaxID=3461391 RepID=UPI004043AD71